MNAMSAADYVALRVQGRVELGVYTLDMKTYVCCCLPTSLLCLIRSVDLQGEFIIGRVIKAMNNSWHPDCFCCDICQAVLADVGFVKNAGRSVPLEISPPSEVKGVFSVHGVRIRDQI